MYSVRNKYEKYLGIYDIILCDIIIIYYIIIYTMLLRCKYDNINYNH